MNLPSIDIVATTTTNQNGIANSLLNKINTINKIQIVEARPDLLAFMGSNQITSKYLRMLIANWPVPTAKFILKPVRPSVYIKATEINFGQPISTPYATAELKKR